MSYRTAAYERASLLLGSANHRCCDDHRVVRGQRWSDPTLRNAIGILARLQDALRPCSMRTVRGGRVRVVARGGMRRAVRSRGTSGHDRGREERCQGHPDVSLHDRKTLPLTAKLRKRSKLSSCLVVIKVSST